MMMKKKLAALLLAAASAMVFTGCGSSDNQSKGGVDKKVQIEYWHVASESFGGTTVKELVADFNAKHPNIQVVEKYNPDMYKGLTQNLQAAIASGKNPDVVQMGWSYLNYAAENLKYTDLQPMIEKQAPEDKNFRIIEKDRHTYRIWNTDLFAVISLSQCQNIRQIILFQEIFVFRT